MTRTGLLNQAIKTVNGHREDSYGSPEQSFEVIAILWSTYLATRKIAKGIDPVDVANMMILLKVARLAGAEGYHQDSLIDIAGYAACAEEIGSKLDRVLKSLEDG